MYTVLIIDSDKTAADQIKEIVPWRHLNCQVIGTAPNAAEGMTKIFKIKPDIIVTDIRLPDFSGLELIHRLSAKDYPGNYIIVTEYQEFKYARMAVELGVSGYLLKPVTAGDVERVIKRIEKSHRQTPQNSDASDGDSSLRLQNEIQERGKEYSIPISVALCYIDRNLYSELSLTALCDVVSLSPSYFSRLFKREVGIGFSAYIRLVKMNQAKSLLQNPRNKAREVAELLGYHNYNYFFQTFKKQFGCSPRAVKNGRHNA